MAAGRLDWGVAAAGFGTFVNLYTTQSLLPVLAAEFQTSLAHTSLTVTASLIAVAVVAPFVGLVSDALGRRRLIIGALFLLALPTLGAALAPSFRLLILCRFLQGLLLPFIFANTVAYVAEERPGPEGVRATGRYAIGTILGGFAGRFIAGWAADLAGWRAGFVLMAAITLALACTVALCLPPERNFRPQRTGLASFMPHLRNKQVMATCLVGFSVLFSTVATFTYANFLLAAPPYNLGPAQLGTIFVTYLLSAAATPLASRLVIRIGRRQTVAIGALCALVGLVFTLMPGLWLIITGLALVAIGIFIEQTLSIGYVAIAARTARATAVGLYVTFYYVGGSLGGVLPAGIWAHLGWPGCVALIFLVQCGAWAVTRLVWPRV